MEDVNISIPMRIPQFYKGKSVLLTGFTGTLGKLIAEKLLFSCPQINKIYAIVRAKRGKTTQERVNQVLESKAFDRLREQYPGAWESKIVAISGDVLEDKLGLSEEDENLLRNEVSIIFHGAASVRFDDSLDMALRVNTMAAKKMVDLALTMNNLISFVYVSTAYSNYDHLYIKEELYPPKADWRETLNIREKIDPAIFQTLHMKYIDKMPNTYVFTKSLSEHVINDYRNELPVVIVRPSIVVPAWKEPTPGWFDNNYGPMSLLLGFLFGVVRCSWVDVQEECNYVQSDICVNGIIVTAWKAAFSLKSKPGRDKVTVFNICEPLYRGMNHRQFSLLYKRKEVMDRLNRHRINFISLLFIRNPLWYRINVLYRHVLPALFIDTVLTLLKKKPVLLKVRMKVFQAGQALSYFSMRTFQFQIDRYHRLYKEMDPEDAKIFYREEIEDGEEYIRAYGKRFYDAFCLSKKTLLKPLYDDLDVNRTRLRWLYIVDMSAVYLTHGLILWIIYVLSIPQLIMSSIVSFFTFP